MICSSCQVTDEWLVNSKLKRVERIRKAALGIGRRGQRFAIAPEEFLTEVVRHIRAKGDGNLGTIESIVDSAQKYCAERGYLEPCEIGGDICFVDDGSSDAVMKRLCFPFELQFIKIK